MNAQRQLWTTVIGALLIFLALVVGAAIHFSRSKHQAETATATAQISKPQKPVIVVSPEEAAQSAGGWVAFPDKELMAIKMGYWAVYIYPISAEGRPLRCGQDVVGMKGELFASYYLPIKGDGDCWRTIRRKWWIGDQLCEVRYYGRADDLFTPTAPPKLFEEIKSNVPIRPYQPARQGGKP